VLDRCICLWGGGEPAPRGAFVHQEIPGLEELRLIGLQFFSCHKQEFKTLTSSGVSTPSARNLELVRGPKAALWALIRVLLAFSLVLSHQVIFWLHFP